MNTQDPQAAGTVETVTTSWLLEHALPGDDLSWETTFAYIEENHHRTASAYWDGFLDDVAKRGVRTPLALEWRRNGKLYVKNGHHRVWAAVRLGVTTLPVLLKDVSGEAPIAGTDKGEGTRA